MRETGRVYCLLLATTFGVAFSADFLSAQAAPPDETVNGLLAAVEKNEQLYDRIDVVLRCDYQDADREGGVDLEASRRAPPGPAIVPVSQFVTSTVLESSETVHSVRQDALVRVDWKETSLSSDGSTRSSHRLLLFDGAVTRLLDEAPADQAASAHQVLQQAVRPHTLLFRALDDRGSLSAQLNSQAAGGRVSYLGQEDFRGLPCYKLQIARRKDSGRTYRTEWWLARTRNLIPVRRLEYDAPVDDAGQRGEMLRAEGVVGQWQELAPEVWFPRSASVTVYDRIAWQREHAQKVRWRKRYTVESVVLDPQHGIEYFRRFEPAAESSEEGA